MQPYLFPYLGYFQLIWASEAFAFLDDVQYIRRGWINRNFLTIAGRRTLFTLPVARAARETAIMDMRVDGEQYPAFRRKLLASIEQSYGSAPHFKRAFELIESVLTPSPDRLCDLAIASVRAVCAHLGVRVPFARASVVAPGRDGSRFGGMAALARALGAGAYINPAAGVELYDPDAFRAAGIELMALHPRVPDEFGAPGDSRPLSVIDSLMRFEPARVREVLEAAEVVSA